MLEDRLREAYRAAAETVRPEIVLQHTAGHVPGADRRVRRPGPRAGRSRPRSRLLIPLAAAAGVALVATTVAVALPRVAPGLGSGPGPAAPTVLTTPGFFVVMNWSQTPTLFVVDAATGKQGARITLPFPASELTGVATGDGQTFVVAAVGPGSCSTSLYRFSLAADGTPSALTEFTTIAGPLDGPWSMAVSANGEIVAQTLACQGGQPQQPSPRDPQAEGYLSLLNTATGQTKQWNFEDYLGNFTTNTGNVSISADGSVVGFGNRVLDTSAAPGPLDTSSRVVVQPGEFGPSVISDGLNVAPDGKSAYFSTFQVAHDKPVGVNWQLRVLDLATGQTRLVRSFPGTGGGPAAGTFDPTGRYLLAESTLRSGPATTLAVLDLATGQLTQLNVAGWVVDPSGTPDPEIAW